jgi:hypothetical protein
MACPICASPEGTTITEGIRAGAGLLILCSTIVIGLIARFVIKIVIQEQRSSTFAKATVDK